MALPPIEAAAIGSLLSSVEGTSHNVRRPGWTNADFLSRPLVKTLPRQVGPVSGWVDYMDLIGRNYSIAVINKYVHTTFGDFNAASTQFRLYKNEGLVPDMQFQAGAERHKTGAAEYPTVPQPTYILLKPNDRLRLQVNNSGAVPQLILAAWYGWYFVTRSPGSPDPQRQGAFDTYPDHA
jgi:hypothetical protein